MEIWNITFLDFAFVNVKVPDLFIVFVFTIQPDQFRTWIFFVRFRANKSKYELRWYFLFDLFILILASVSIFNFFSVTKLLLLLFVSAQENDYQDIGIRFEIAHESFPFIVL